GAETNNIPPNHLGALFTFQVGNNLGFQKVKWEVFSSQITKSH
ncbi:MAG: hypothetical protein RL632_1578, partial [Bacteroidota bacterium]